MTTTQIIEQFKTLPPKQQKAVLRVLSQELEDEFDARLFDDRSREPDGRTPAGVVSRPKPKP